MSTSKNQKIKGRPKKNKSPKLKDTRKLSKDQKNFFLTWLLVVLGITALCLYPMLNNGFTNWDDEIYVTNNPLLTGPDWKGIFTQPVSANYHPLTLLSLVINYKLTGLDPSSYLVFNYLLHLINTGLVFYFIWIISDKKIMVAFLTALVFGIHPMHVESVAWVSERKDVLYTFFFLLSLLQYWRYLQKGKSLNYWFSFLLFVLSLLSKPAAIILPLVLFLLDYWKGNEITKKSLLEKIPFFLLSILFGILTVKMQSVNAIAGLEIYPWWARLFFACYVVMIYFFRFFIPYPLSAFHPYPSPENLGLPVLLSPIFILALAIFLWYQRKNRLIVFGFLFFVINLLLVLQIISIGNTIISERYTYVPYIGLAFVLSMILNQYSKSKLPIWATSAAVVFIFGIISFQRTKVWKDSNSLWSDVISHYPYSPVPRTNRANYTIKEAMNPDNKAQRDILFQEALEDCNIALNAKPNHTPGYEDRQFIYYNLNKNKEALADAEKLIKLDPRNKLGYYTRGLIFMRLNDPAKALADFDTCLSIKPDYDAALNNRGTVLVNSFQKYAQALVDFNKAISINPDGNYYLNRSVCNYKLGNTSSAKADAQIAVQKGTVIPANYRQLLNL
jgi:tetratricopeptide (TPR) repeat protein